MFGFNFDNFDRLIRRSVHKTLDERLPDLMAEAMKRRAFARIPVKDGYQLTRVGFAWEIANEFIRNGMAVWEARDAGYDALRQFLNDEKIKFGQPDYDWGIEGAVALAQEEMQHWEAIP